MVGVLLLVGCMSNEAVGLRQPRCEPNPQPAVVVYVQDFVTKQYIGSGASLFLQDGAFRDSVSVPANRPELDSQQLATPKSVGREGSYVVRVRRPPYADFVVASVRAGTDGCNVQPVVLSAQMRMPLGG